MAVTEKRKDTQVEEDSSGDVAVRDAYGLEGDKMTLKAFLAVVVYTAYMEFEIANHVWPFPGCCHLAHGVFEYSAHAFVNP